MRDLMFSKLPNWRRRNILVTWSLLTPHDEAQKKLCKFTSTHANADRDLFNHI